MSNELRKSDVERFVRHIWGEAVDHINKQYQPEIDKLYGEMLEPFESIINEVAHDFAVFELQKERLNVALKVGLKSKEGKEVARIKRTGYDNYDRVLRLDKGYNMERPNAKEHMENYRKRLIDEFKARITTDELEYVLNCRTEDRKTTNAAYQKVLDTLKPMTSVKKCLAYLTEIGFDVSKIVKQEPKKPEVNVSKDALFPCLKETKAQEV